MKNRNHLRALCEGAIFVALAQVLGYVKFWRMPWGGSVTLIMLPIFLYCIRWGFGRGMLAAFALSCLQFLLDSDGFVIGWQSILGDFLLAYSALGVAGLFSKVRGGLIWGTIAGSFARFLVHYVTGATLWAEYMPESFLGLTMTSPWIYSALYNGLYVGLGMLACLAVAVAISKPLGKYLRAEDLR